MNRYLYVWSYGHGKREKEAIPRVVVDSKSELRFIEDVTQPYISWIDERKGTWASLTVWRYDTVLETMEKIDEFEYSKFDKPLKYLNAKINNIKSTEEDNIPF